MENAATYETFDPVNRNYVFEIRVSKKPVVAEYSITASPTSYNFSYSGGSRAFTITSTKTENGSTTSVGYTLKSYPS